jgi:hypothetical protein
MTNEIPINDRWTRIPIAVTVVLIGVIANLSVDMIAKGELSQWTEYRKWEPYGIFAVYYPMGMGLFRWLIPVLGVGVIVAACQRQLSARRFVWAVCVFAVIAAMCVAIGVFMVYGLYSVTHHVLGG